MWFFAELVFTQPRTPRRRMYICETCEILLNAESAEEAYAKANAWAATRLREDGPGQELLGVSRLTPTLDEEIGDGMEITGSIIQKRDVWDRKDRLIPPRDRLSAFILEQRSDVPLGEVIADTKGPQAVSLLKRLFKPAV